MTGPTTAPIDLERLAKALYETAPGTNGYPPAHTTRPWKEAEPHGLGQLHRERAAAIIALMRRA